MDNRNKKLIGILLILLFILVILIALIIWRDKKNSQTPNVKQHKVEQQDSLNKKIQNSQTTNTDTKKVIKKSEKKPDDQSMIMGVSRFFVERYGSFSSEANWQNLKDLKSSVTRQLWSDFEDLMANTKVDKENYRSLSTKILNLRIVSQDKSKAVVEANTQKKEISSNQEKVFYQDVKVYLVKDGDNWLVSRFEQGKESR